MAGLVCDICGGKLMSDESGEIFTCESCGTRYPKERVKKMFAEVSGTVRVENVANLESLFKRAGLALCDSDFRQATEYYNKTLDIDPEYAPSYVGLLMAKRGIRREEDLGSLSMPIDRNTYYQKAFRFGDASLRGRLDGYRQMVDERVAAIRKSEQDMIDIKRREAKRIENIKRSVLSSINDKTGCVKWQVLELDEANHRMLVISKDCVSKGHFDARSYGWGNSEIRHYLNGEFQNWLHLIGINQICETPDGNIFLLSAKEAKKYFPNDKARIAKHEGTPLGWWLRSHEDYSDSAVIVSRDGYVSAYNKGVNLGAQGVRPAFWLNLDS